MKEIERAIKIAGSEIFTLSEYLKDTDMKLIHGQRFEKMIGALKILTKLAQKVIDSKDVVSVDSLAILILQAIRGCSEKTAIELWTGKHYITAHKDIADRVSRSFCAYINPIITKIQQEKENLLSRVAKVNKINEENTKSAVDYENRWNIEKEMNDELLSLIPIFAKLLKRIEKLESNLEYPTKKIEELESENVRLNNKIIEEKKKD